MPCTPGCGSCCDPVHLGVAAALDIFGTFGPMSAQKAWVTQNWEPVGVEPGGYRLKCANYDVESRACTIYDKRPPVCRDYPSYKGVPDPDRLVCGYQADAGRTVLPIVEVR